MALCLASLDLPAAFSHNITMLNPLALLLSLIMVIPFQSFLPLVHIYCHWKDQLSKVEVFCPTCIWIFLSLYSSAGTSGDCTQVAYSRLVGGAVGQMEQGAVSAFHKAAEGRVDESPQRVTEAQQKCHLTLPTWMWSKYWHFPFVILVHAVWRTWHLHHSNLPTLLLCVFDIIHLLGLIQMNDDTICFVY